MVITKALHALRGTSILQLNKPDDWVQATFTELDNVGRRNKVVHDVLGMTRRRLQLKRSLSENKKSEKKRKETQLPPSPSTQLEAKAKGHF